MLHYCHRVTSWGITFIGEVLQPGKGSYLNSGSLRTENLSPAASAILCRPGSLGPPKSVLSPVEEEASHPWV